jgi:SAM-dependent methyltransferase
MTETDDLQSVEKGLQAVYDYCPPTRTIFRSPQAWEEFSRSWGDFLDRLDAGPTALAGRRLLDIGCGSCEKAALYHDWGVTVTGIDLSSQVLDFARETLRGRNVDLIKGSLFDLKPTQDFDFVFVDGVSFITADTVAALSVAVSQLAPDGTLVFSLTNIWGRFWWFGLARLATRILGGRDFHRRARWGRRLFRWTRATYEATEGTGTWYRSDQSWAYDWFGPPAYHLHSPAQVLRWLDALGLRHKTSVPSITHKTAPRTWQARVFRAMSGRGHRMMSFYWLLNGEPSMVYVSASRK